MNIGSSLPELGMGGFFDAVVCIAVLHFAPDLSAFNLWACSCWKRLRPGGIFLARLSTRISMPENGDPQGRAR
jgi:tellurite methyltransferase